MVSNVPMELIRVAKKKARNAKEALLNFKHYIKNLKTDYITPSRLKKLTKQLEKKTKEAVEEHKRIFTPKKEASAFKSYTYQYVINNVPGYGPIEFLNEAKPAIINIFNSNRNIKTILYLYCFMSQGERMKEFAFHSSIKLILEGTDLNEIYDEMVEEITEEIHKAHEAEGSGWQFFEIINLTLHTTRWDPLNAGSYIDLPPFLKNKKAIINMQNKDNECFMWSVLRALNPKDKNAERIDNDLKSKQDTLNMKGIKYPVSFRDIDRFESQNPNISISVIGYNQDERVYPLKVSKYTGCEHDITLLLIKEVVEEKNGEKKENSHYCLVKNMSALIASQINSIKELVIFV